MNNGWETASSLAICLICGQRGNHEIFISSSYSIVPASGTKLAKFFFKVGISS